MSSSTESILKAPLTEEQIQQLRQILSAVGYSIVFLKEEATGLRVNGVKMPGPDGILPLVLKISWASTAQEMALYAIGVARKAGCYEPHHAHIRLILESTLQRIS